MSDSPISDRSAIAFAIAGAGADNNLQPFFVLHKPPSSAPPKTRRKIQLASQPEKPEPASSTDAAYERMRLEALDLTWSRIDSAIKQALRGINLNLFDQLLHWVQQSRGSDTVHDLCKRIDTAFVLTKNAEFVDDLMTFHELGVHLRSNGCYVVNLSPADFSSKHGVGGCVRGLLRQLVRDASDMADIEVLELWYSEVGVVGKPVVVIVDDMERCDGAVLAEFIIMLSEWVGKIPIIFIMGVATSVDAPRRLLPSVALQHLKACKFMLGSPFERMNAIIEAVLVKSCSSFNIGHNVALFLKSYFLRHDGTITAFIKALKLACTKHFTEEPLSFLGQGILDEDYEAFWGHKCEELPEDLRRCAFGLPSNQRSEFCEGNGVNITRGLSELRRLQNYWSSVVMCLFEVGKMSKMQLLDIYCEIIDPALYSRRASDNNLSVDLPIYRNQTEGSFGYVKGGFVAQAIHKVRELPLVAIIHLLNFWSIHTKEMKEIHEKVGELQTEIESSYGDKQLTQTWNNTPKRLVSSTGEKGSPSNDKAAMILEAMVRNFLMPLECMPFHEIFCFKRVDILQLALIGDPRRIIQVDLLKSPKHLQCSCCDGGENALSSSMHDTSIMYILAQEYGDLINLHDWYQSFRSTVLGSGTKTKQKVQRSPALRKVNASPSESEATIQARFCRAVTELQITGLLRMPSKRRPDFVQRVAFGL